MLQHFHAIYEDGVLRPLEPLALSDHQQVWVSLSSVSPVSPDTVDKASAQRRAMEELDAVLAALPDRSPSDGFTAADHDKILYGKSE